MAERVNKLYKPAELVAVVNALQQINFGPVQLDNRTAVEVVKSLHKLGFRIVKVTDK